MRQWPVATLHSPHFSRSSAAARDKAASTSLRSLTVLDILFKYASRAELRAPRIHGLLTRLATQRREKCGLAPTAEAQRQGCASILRSIDRRPIQEGERGFVVFTIH